MYLRRKGLAAGGARSTHRDVRRAPPQILSRTPRRPGAALRTLAATEAGFSLIELLIVLSILALVLATLVGPMVTGQRVEAKVDNYATAQQDASTGLESMVAQIRQATTIFASSGNSVTMNVTLGAQQLLVSYECDIAQSGTPYRECMRVQTSQGGTLPSFASGQIVVTRLLNGTPSSPVFSWGPDPNAPYYMTATVDVPASAGQYYGLNHTIVFSDGALMRNLNVGN